ncbi:sugar ABC transporter substrate-binding protein [Bacillus sp. FJAT-27264]|uniref:sugar ABC transporter substrate-binding protein n=1 Tax=Paenibacillus sp. (strain DSM 101736 / FJAT-27264) TaxID=1850362 RepID=UPI000807EE14|nr:substrate-binding domain-containing protein [Bacillus sp. FJAT-27264]OBZ14341.1 sugar ABC transporter substrate-binding protein [Bacillus sp. FJAT-27264]
MRKTVSILLGIACLTFIVLTVISSSRLFSLDRKLVQSSDQTEESDRQEQYRLVLITRDQDTPFWDQVSYGAKKEAKKDGANIEVWGSYGEDEDNFLKGIEIAIESRVDGIIVQGLDSDDFKNLTKIKAAFYGIPIITVANDVPMGESLRKTYVGSDQYLAGQMIAKQLIADIDKQGIVVVIGDSRNEYYQQQRLRGIQDVLRGYPKIVSEYVSTGAAREQVISAIRETMNMQPDVNAFISVNANITGSMIQEISRRSRIEPYAIYSFDDSPDAMTLLKQGKLDGILKQSPEEMGKISVEMMMKWLKGEVVPLNTTGYLTDIEILKEAGTP